MTKIEKLVAAARKTLRVLGWTPSRFAKWKECPSKVLYEDLMHMCPVCFVGRVSGGYSGEPVKCDTCKDPQPERPQLDRGNRLDDALTAHVAGASPDDVAKRARPEADPDDEEYLTARTAHQEHLMEASQHPWISKLVKKLRKAKGVGTQTTIVLDKGWQVSPKGIYTKNAWARLKLDVLVLKPKIAEVLDWKSGNIDNRANPPEIREKHEYHDSMRMYQAAVLTAYPQAEASAMMVFLDAPKSITPPTKSLPVLERRDLMDAQKDIERKIEPMMADTNFGPRPGYYCGWCPFQKAKGGPCPF